MWITGSYDPVLNLTYWGTAQAKPWMTLTRGTEDDALYSSSTLAINVDTGKKTVAFPTCSRRRRWISTSFSSACLSIPAERILCSPSARTAFCGNSIAKPASISAMRKRSFRMSGTSFDPKTGNPKYRDDILHEDLGKAVDACPTSAGGHNWPATSYHQPTDLLIAPLVQACQVMVPSAANLDGTGNGGGAAALVL